MNAPVTQPTPGAPAASGVQDGYNGWRRRAFLALDRERHCRRAEATP